MRQGSDKLWLAPIVLLLASGAHAENIDPASVGQQYAWGENVGWVNAEPEGDGGSGVQVEDFFLTGWIWSENVGWISLSCENTASCGNVDYGVINDGQGVLTGYAWSENAGWINFSPTSGGVLIDPATGIFGGTAWGENVGWISFATQFGVFELKTGWSCSPLPPVPVDVPALTVGKSGANTLLSWIPVPNATGVDVVRGDLDVLRSTDGDFTAATTDCLADNRVSPDLVDPAVPLPGRGLWFLVRPVNCGTRGTYDSGGVSQLESRDVEIDTAASACP